MQVSAILRSQPNIAATNDPASNGASRERQPDRGERRSWRRCLAGRWRATRRTSTVNLALPGDVYPERLNTVDMRVSKILRFGRTRSNVGIDLYNLFNANTGTAFNGTFGQLTTTGSPTPQRGCVRRRS